MAKTVGEKGRELLKSKSKFPLFSLLDYDRSMRENLQYYNIEVEDSKLKKAWAIKYWKDENKDVSKISKLNDAYFSTVGAVVHMAKFRELALEAKDLNFISDKYTYLSTLIVHEDDDAVVAKTKEERADAEFDVHVAEFEYGLDLFFKNETFDAKKYLIRNNTRPGITKRIADHFKVNFNEIKMALSGTDEQLTESYSHMTRRELTRYLAYIKTMIDSCEVATAIAKAARKPKVTKVKSPSELVKNVKYMENDPTTSLASLHPARVINSIEAWVYNVKNRRLFRYVALEGSKLSVKGTTLINIDQEKSGGKIVRKPGTQLIGIQNMSNAAINKIFDGVRGTQSRATGRLNEETLIVRCFN